MIRPILLASGMFLLATGAGASPRHPTGKWVVNYDEAQCTAMRNYGTEKVPVFFILKPSATGGTMRLIVMEDGRTATAAPEVGSLRFGTGLIRAANFLRYPDPQTRTRSVAVNLSMSEFKKDASAKTVFVKAAFVNDEFVMSDLPAVIAALDECLLDLQEAWHLSPDQEPLVSPVPTPERPMYTYFSPEDYPQSALNQDQQGSVRYTLLVDAQGAIKDCSIEQTSGIATLDTMTCYALASRAKFRPAVGPDGKTIRSAYKAKLNWRIDAE